MAIARKHIAATTLDQMRKDVQTSGRQDPCRGFAPLIWHLRPGNLLILSLWEMLLLRFWHFGADLLLR
eukprot:652612-Pyramimonas_sp.AAC.1